MRPSPNQRDYAVTFVLQRTQDVYKRQPNALLTLQEYLEDYASPATRELGLEMISQQLPTIPNERVRSIAQQRLQQIKAGERDFRF